MNQTLRRPDGWILPAEATADGAFVRLHAYWFGKIRDGRLPGRADIDPAEIPADILPHVALLGVESGPERRRFRIRLFGSKLDAMTGADETGHYYDEVVEPAAYALMAPQLDRVVEDGCTGYYAAPSGATGRRYLLFGRLALPLASDGVTVDMILGLVRPLMPGPL